MQEGGGLFKLKFTLQKIVGKDKLKIEGAECYSNPIDVYSHTTYLDKPEKSAPPVIKEVLPNMGGINSRVAIIGSSFVSTANLTVRFGNIITTPQFHDSGTLICSAPQQTSSSNDPVLVSISNDGNNFCQSQVTFVYL